MTGGYDPGVAEATSEPTGVDLRAADLVLEPGLPGLLGLFNRAGVLAPSDVHLARRLAGLVGDDDELVGLAVALAGRAPRVGHVSVDLATVRSSAVVGEDEGDAVDRLPWPDPPGWISRVATSALVDVEPAGADSGVAGNAGGAGCRPLHLDGTHLYLDRYWRDELEVARDLLRRAGPDAGAPAPPPGSPGAGVAGERLEALFPGAAAEDQRRAAGAALSGRLTVIAGGPGTGKTTTVARLLALLVERAVDAGRRTPLIGLAAPTGKAAARMEEAVRAEAGRLPVDEAIRAHLDAVAGSTIHRLLGSRPDRVSRFRHHRGHRLPHDVVVVDEASMVSLALMARLLEAVRPDAHLILVGDPEQLVSVEAGAVLADIVVPTGSAQTAEAERDRPGTGIGSRIALLRTNHRFSGPLADLASAIRSGDAAATLELLASGAQGVRWLPVDPERWGRPPVPPNRQPTGAGEPAAAVEPVPGGDAGVEGLRRVLTGWAAGIVTEARAGRSRAALDALSHHRLLCAHRDGPAGVAVWNRRIEQWVADLEPDLGVEGTWYAGRPVMVTANDYALRVFNGDTGVVVVASRDPGLPADAGPGRPRSEALTVTVDGPGGRVRTVSPYRLPAVETVFATTVHKSQGSEYERVTLILPAESSRLLTRELIYTAVTRARQEVLVVGSEASVRRAVARPLSRASGLGRRLWGGSVPPG